MDPANILSILASLGSGQQPTAAPSNFLQQAAPSLPAYAPPPAAPVQAPQAAPEPPRQRRSLLDTIGRISDVLAKVGGADALYQPTLDAREDRTLSLGDHARQVDLDALKKTLTQQQVAAGALEPQVAERKRIGIALGALVGHEADAAALWPHIADQAGIDPQRAAALGQMITNNPASAGILAKSLGADTDTLGKNVFFGTDKQGKTVAYQVGPDGNPHILDFSAAGVTPSEPIKVVNTGGSNVIVGQGGNVKTILPNTAAPGTVLTTKTQKEIADNSNATAITIAGMPARAAATATGAIKSSPRDALAYLDNIQAGFDSLHQMGALPGDTHGLGAVESAIGRTGFGQKIGVQLDSPAAQKRLELVKNINSLQSEMLASLPGSATRTKFEQEIQKARLPDPAQMSYSTAKNVIRELRQQYQRALTDLAKEKKTPVVPKSSGWSIVGVK